MADRIGVTLKPFAKPRVQQEAVKVCQRFNERRIKTLSGKLIEMTLLIAYNFSHVPKSR
jgi:hypothetical protein